MVKAVEKEMRNGERSLQLSLTETESYIVYRILCNVQLSTEGPGKRVSEILSAVEDFILDSEEGLDEEIQEKFPNHIMDKYGMEYDELKGLHFPKVEKSNEVETNDRPVTSVELPNDLSSDAASEYLYSFIKSFEEVADKEKTSKEPLPEGIEEINGGYFMPIKGHGYVQVFNLDDFRKN